MIDKPFAPEQDQLRAVEALMRVTTPSASAWKDEAAADYKLAAKHYYFDAQGMRCCYCRRLIMVEHMRAWDLEHIAAKGTYPAFLFEPMNLALACIICNERKGTTEVFASPATVADYPRASEAFLICHPHLDDWDRHIEIVGDFLYLPVNNSSKGKFTINTCDLGRFVGELSRLRFNPKHPEVQDAVRRMQSDDEREAERAAFELYVRIQKSFS